MRFVNLTEIAGTMGISTRHVQQLVVAGMPKAQRGRYDLVAIRGGRSRRPDDAIQLKHAGPLILPAPANASDAGGSLAGSCPRTNARHQLLSESQRLECS